MVKKIYLCVFVLICQLGFSQSQTINKGKIIKDRQFLIDKTEVTTCDESGNFVSIRPHRINGSLNNYFVELFEGLDFSERHEIETDNTTEILDVFIKQDKVHVLIKEYDNKSTSIRFDLFDLKEKTIVKKTLICAEKEIDKRLFNTLKYESSISVIHNSDYILCFPVVEEENAFTYLEFFDSNLNSLSVNKIYPNKDVNRKNTSFLNVTEHNGAIYVLHSLFDKEQGNYYQLTELKNNEIRHLVLPIENDIYQLINTKVHGDDFIINGLFSKQKKGAFEGFSYYNINLKTLKINSEKHSNFLTEEARKYFIGLFKGDRSIDIKNLFVDSNQNTYLVGQFYKMQRQYVPIGIPIASLAIGSFSAFITYNPISISYKVYDDILISKINSSGELIWDNILELKSTEKINVKSNKQDSSYFAFLENDQLNILLNGYIDMEKDKIIVKQDKRNSKTKFYNIALNKKGDIIPKTIFPNAKSDILFRAEGTIKVDNTIFNLGQGNMRKQLLKLDL